MPAAQLLGHPGPAVGALERLDDQRRVLQDRAQVRPHQLVKLGTGMNRAGQQLAPPELTCASLPRQR